MADRSKSPRLALLLSCLLPGLGHLYAGRPGLGLGLMAAYLYSLLLIFSVLGLITAPAIWLFAMGSAYEAAAGRFRPGYGRAIPRLRRIK